MSQTMINSKLVWFMWKSNQLEHTSGHWG